MELLTLSSSSSGSVGTYLSGLSELPLKQSFFYYLPASLFPFHHVLEEPYFPVFCYCGPFVPVIYEHAFVEHLLHCSTASTTQPSRKAIRCRSACGKRRQADREHLLYCSTASTAQHSGTSPHKTAKQVRADESVTTQANRQSWRETACRLPPPM